MLEIYICPLMFVGYFILIFGQKLQSDMASLIRVYEPLINAWLAIIAAIVDNKIPKREKPGWHDGKKWIGSHHKAGST